MTEHGLETSVPDWVIDHPETVTLFEELCIDYSCGGKSLSYACQQKGLDPEAVLLQIRILIDHARKDGQ